MPKTYDLDLTTRAALEHVRAVMNASVRLARHHGDLQSPTSERSIKRAENILHSLVAHGELPRIEYAPNQGVQS